MIRISQERQRFICVGGDGTINEIVNSAPCNDNVEFGVIPAGTGNDFVRNFTNKELFSSIDAQIDGTAIPLNLLKCNEKYCVNMVNIGFDCAVVKESDKLKKIKLFPAPLSYIGGIIATVFKKIGTNMRVIYDDGNVIEKTFTLVAIGNGRYCGGGFCGVPRAILNDGLADVCAIDKISVFKFFTLVGSYKKGTHLVPQNASVLSTKDCKTLDLVFEGVQSASIDGEVRDINGTLRIEIIRNGLNFVIPKGSAFKKEENRIQEEALV